MKNLFRVLGLIYIIFLLNLHPVFSRNFADQHHTWYTDSIKAQMESASGIILSADSSCFQLADDQTYGYLILNPAESQEQFNRGLPSWNGTAPDEKSGFLIQMRFPYNGGWSPWLTVGFWKAYIWSSYGATSYPGGMIDYDYVKLNSYQSSWQFKIHMARTSVSEPSPTLHKLSFFVSDSRTTDSINIDAIVDDNPSEILVETEFYYQYALDDDIGGSICSPTSVSMVLRSLAIDVDPLQFAKDTYDPYYHIFGIWPRVVQNASEHANIDGAVTRYRTWSEARNVLANGGRVVMSVGLPLYEGHLMMLAGFTSSGNPIVHDPARSNGYAYVYNKRSLSESWFNKGGVAYTFYPGETGTTAIKYAEMNTHHLPDDFELFQNYPNPFNPATTINYQLRAANYVDLSIYDMLGKKIVTLVSEQQAAGKYQIEWNAGNLSSGNYLIVLKSGTDQKIIRAVLVR
jgi:hypothetical protein